KRLSIQTEEFSPPEKIKGTVRVHCGYHKCLTMYFREVFSKIVKYIKPFKGTYRHFYHRLNEFNLDCSEYTISSISGAYINPDNFEDIKITRFIRDPRDLIISGYFYHKRSGEDWCDHYEPTNIDWAIVNGNVPQSLPKGMTFAQYLNNVSLEEGLLAEIEFRKYHFESMLQWPDNDERIKTFRYEDIMNDQVKCFQDIFDFYEVPFWAKIRGKSYAKKYSVSKRKGKSKHIRNPSSGQWRKYFTPALHKTFNENYEDLLTKLGYPIE
ncbi:MAG: sulfotransferase domain-containing protein, partial [Nitrospinae bacterium]|nr:sulfotransferase domain-containing protein [Nitrospinota bacterium]